MRFIIFFFISIVLIGISNASEAGQTFDSVKNRGQIICGVHTGLNGFGAPDQKGNWTGIDVDVCRAVAAAMFGDAKKVRYVPLSAQQRLPALQSGEVDLLSRITAWTLTREASNGLLFTNINFYDGQGFLVSKKLGVKSAKELNTATICVQTGTTTELNLSDFARVNRLNIKPLTIESFEETSRVFISGRCDAITADSSQLATI
ncbi:MAG: transporter substrate-binding domain-containing protein, partial [Rhodospirillaceae bacterium]|nr:transporter substrate-binding domain-containing protein [Rhodospirillaceae bacterium]